MTATAASLAALLPMCGCSGSRTTTNSKTTEATIAGAVRFVAASAGVRAKCRATARAVGYSVPCPTRLPIGLGSDVIGPGGIGGTAMSWRRWVVGSSNADDLHLVITASPHALSNYAKLVNGPAWYPQARVRPLGWARINGRRMRSIYVPTATYVLSSFMNNFVIEWNVV
jgi:hypothetical protein